MIFKVSLNIYLGTVAGSF